MPQHEFFQGLELTDLSGNCTSVSVLGVTKEGQLGQQSKLGWKRASEVIREHIETFKMGQQSNFRCQGSIQSTSSVTIMRDHNRKVVFTVDTTPQALIVLVHPLDWRTFCSPQGHQSITLNAPLLVVRTSAIPDFFVHPFHGFILIGSRIVSGRIHHILQSLLQALGVQCWNRESSVLCYVGNISHFSRCNDNTFGIFWIPVNKLEGCIEKTGGLDS
mmetsp:Transcript_6649/g.15649  ORF Transcript_6649/g.15649 Transcript_6649/m.15649 type:complete len:217 (+) Transcript_6649:1325-1975(+)